MNIVQIDNWQEYQRDGEQFLHVAEQAFVKKKKTFSPEALYNLTCMGIEKVIMAFLMHRGDLAENHTMGDLMRAIELHLGEQEELKKKMTYLDQFQEICDLENYEIRIPTNEDVEKILEIGEEIKTMLLPYLKTDINQQNTVQI